MRKSNVGATSLPYSPLQKWGLGPWASPTPALGKEHPSPLLGLQGFGVAMLHAFSGQALTQPRSLVGVHPCS